MKRYLRMILNIVIPFLGLCLVIFLGPRLLRFFMPFVVGWILALLANPLVRFLERRVKLVRRHGSMLIIIAALAIVISLLRGGSSGLPGNGKFSGGCTGNISECDR